MEVNSGLTTVSRRLLLQLTGASALVGVAATGRVSAASASHVQVPVPSVLSCRPTGPNQTAFIEDPDHSRGRGFYVGTATGNWQFAGWLAQTRPAGRASGSVTPSGNATAAKTDFAVVDAPRDLRAVEPREGTLAFVKDAAHARGRGFYVGTKEEAWSFVGWLAQTQPETLTSESIDPTPGATRPTEHVFAVTQPTELSSIAPRDNDLAFVRGGDGDRSRGFYSGGADGRWYFVGWLRQEHPTRRATGQVRPHPSVSVVAPDDGATVRGSVPVRVAVRDACEAAHAFDVAVAVDGGTWHAATYDSGRGSFEWTWNPAAAAVGTHTIEARVVGSGGMTESSPPITVTVTAAHASSTSGGGRSGSNYVFVTDSQLQTAKNRVDAGTEPFRTAYNQLINEANADRKRGLQAVTDDSAGDHRWVEGSDRGDYTAASTMGPAARNCALAYWFTGDDSYARKVVDILYHWCLNGSTYMEPTENLVGTGVTVEQNITIPNFVYAASFVRDHPRWDRYNGHRPWDGGNSGDAESAFERWVSDRLDTFGANMPSYNQTNNQWAWRIVDAGASWAYLESDSGVGRLKDLVRAKDSWSQYDGRNETRPWEDYQALDATKGFFGAERSRGDGFGYSNYNLTALAEAMLIVEAYDGTNLWEFNAPTDPHGGSTLHKAFAWMAPYVTDMGSWRWNDGSNAVKTTHHGDEAGAVFELAYAHWGDFEAAVTNTDVVGGRPHPEARVLGPVTLTHGAP